MVHSEPLLLVSAIIHRLLFITGHHCYKFQVHLPPQQDIQTLKCMLDTAKATLKLGPKVTKQKAIHPMMTSSHEDYK